MRLAKIALAGLAAAGVLALAGVGGLSAASSAAEPDRSISVEGSGSITVVPDRAQFSFGVETRGKTASEALTANGTELRRVIAAIRGSGIDGRDIQTQQVSLSPIYSDNGSSVIGYSASNTVGVTLRKLGDAGALIDKAVAAGANQVNGPALNRADQSALYRKALEAALADARAKAETIAVASGLTLGRAASVSETSEPPVRPVDLKAAADSTPIEAGSQEVQASVTVTYTAT